MSTDASPDGSSSAAASPAEALPRWFWRGLALVAMVVGWAFIAWHNHFYFTPSVVFLGLGWGAAVAAVYLLWRVGAAGGQEELARDSWWVEGTQRDELEREKRVLLRSIREIEFDHQTGKLSDQDAEEMNRVVRARAIEVMKALDAMTSGDGDVRAEIERELRARVEIENARKAAKKGKGAAKKDAAKKDTAKADGKADGKGADKRAEEPASSAARAETTAGAPAAVAAEEPVALAEVADASAPARGDAAAAGESAAAVATAVAAEDGSKNAASSESSEVSV